MRYGCDEYLEIYISKSNPKMLLISLEVIFQVFNRIQLQT